MYDIDNYEMNFDLNGDGITDALAVDHNGDGILDEIWYDTDYDGAYDSVLMDLNEDGIIDAAVDTDGDGVIETAYIANDPDDQEEYSDGGDALDLDGDGYYESTGFDTNHDGQYDAIVSDTTGDGNADTVYSDTNHNGIFETVLSETDTDGDGRANTYSESCDYDEDGTVDSITQFTDVDGDENFDVVTKTFDSDDDGILDTSHTYIDTNGDGRENAVFEEQLIDSDGDGNFDTYIARADENADGIFEATEIYDASFDSGELVLEPVSEISGYYTSYESSYRPARFDPDSSDPTKVIGDPASAMEEWEFQGNTGRCALYSQKFIIEQLTDEEIDIEKFADTAEEHGWFDEEGGTSMLNMNKMLDFYNIDNEMSFHNDMDDIKECLSSGGKVIVAVDSGEIWSSESSDIFDPGDGADHAVEVIGIDYSDPDNPMVVLNDSGTPDGCGELVPMHIFIDAWEDSNCQMITCA